RRFTPPVGDRRVYVPVRVELRVGHPYRQAADAVGHLALLVAVRLQHRGIEIHLEQSAYRLDNRPWIANQVLEMDPQLAPFRNPGQEVKDILMACDPGELGKPLDAVRALAVERQDTVEARFLERAYRPARVPHEMDVDVVLERGLRAFQRLRGQGIGR